MVFHDLSSLHSQSENKKKQLSIASPTDRLLACFLDFLILGPIVGLFTAVYLRELRSYAFYDVEGLEVGITFFLMALIAILTTSLIQAIFLILGGASPGQRFLHLKVIPLDSSVVESSASPGISFSQAMLRTLTWWFALPLFLIPFLEVFSHPLRRAFHDRISDTVVICLKGRDSRPNPSESRLLTSWMQMFSFGLFAIFILIINRIEDKTLEGNWSSAKAQPVPSECAAVDLHSTDIRSRMDQALALYITENLSSRCLGREADFALWQRQSRYYPLAYFIKSVISEDIQERGGYQERICIDSKSEECILSKFWSSRSKSDSESLRKSGMQLAASRILMMEYSIQHKEFSSALALVNEFLNDPNLEEAVAKSYVRLIWEIEKTYQPLDGSRSPASKRNPSELGQTDLNSTELESALKAFKERFDIE